MITRIRAWPPTARAAILTVVVLAVLSVVTIAVRAVIPDDPEPDAAQEASMTMTPEIARDRFWEDFREVEQLVEPAVPFELRTMSQPEGRSRCDVPNGPLGGGHLYFIHAHESSAPIDDPVAKAELVIEHWNAKGYEMQMFGADGEDLFRQVIALTHEGNVLNFTVGPTGMGLGGETACVPTDD